MSRIYRDRSGHFVSREVYFRNQERRLNAQQQIRVGGRFAKKQNYSWLFWLGLGAIGIALLSLFI